LTARERQSRADPSPSEAAAEPQLYDLPQILQAYAPSHQQSPHRSQLLSRPSNVTAHAYQGVTQAYFQAVHSVLTGEQGAHMAATALERELVAVNGFKVSPSKTE